MSRPLIDGLRARFGADLAALVGRRRAPLARAVLITGLPSGTLARATFRLDFSDGHRLKGRRFDDPAHAARMRALVRQLALPGLPRILALRGAAVLEEWVPGTPLDRVRATPRLLRHAGRLLGAIHAVDGQGTLGPAPPTPEARCALIERSLAELAALSLLAHDQARRLLDAARAHRPVHQDVGIIHRDFCAENLVLDARGGLHVVDNGTLTVDARDFDLARTWYRWPMTPTQRRTFEEGYGPCRDLASFHAHSPFWSVAVLVDAALFRHHAKTADPAAPLRHLQEALRRPGRSPGRARAR